MSTGGADAGAQRWDPGSTLAGYAWPAAEPRAALLLQHGFGEYAQRFATAYSGLIPHLVDLGVSVYAFDAWGHGGSPGRRAVTDLERTTQVHRRARKVLADTVDAPLFLLGHSMGGLITAASVAADPAGVAGVILSAPALRADIPAPLAWAMRALAAFAPAAGSGFGRIAPETLYAGAQTDPVLQHDPQMYRGSLPLLLCASGFRLMRDAWEWYPSWTTPVLVLHGGDDRPEVSRAFYERIASADKTLHVVPDGRHELLNDTAAANTLALLLAWLDERIPQRRATGGPQAGEEDPRVPDRPPSA